MFPGNQVLCCRQEKDYRPGTFKGILISVFPVGIKQITFQGGSLQFYDRKRAAEESLSNLRVLEGKLKRFLIFYHINMRMKSKPDSEFLAFPLVKFRKI